MPSLIRRMMRALGWRIRCRLAMSMAGMRTRSTLRTHAARRVLVICHGNINRSPYVAGRLRQHLDGLCEVRSVGLFPVGSRPPPARTVQFASRHGVNIADHLSKIVTPTDVIWAEIIVLMDRHNWQAVTEMRADSRKLVWLGALEGYIELADPHGTPDAEAEKIMLRVHRCTEALAAVMLARRGLPAAQPGSNFK